MAPKPSPMPRGERYWSDPKRPSDLKFSDLCKKHKIDPENTLEFREFLDELIKYIQAMMADIRPRRQLRDERKECEKHIANIENAIKWISRFSYLPGGREGRWKILAPHGNDAMSLAAAQNLSHMINPLFLVQIVGETPRGLSSWSLSDSETQQWAQFVIRDNSGRVLAAVLEAIQNSLSTAAVEMQTKTPRGGPPAYVVGPFLLLNLCGAFHRLGRAPASNVKGPFGRFVTDVVLAIGWDTGWVDSHLRAAVSKWRLRTRRKPLKTNDG